MIRFIKNRNYIRGLLMAGLLILHLVLEEEAGMMLVSGNEIAAIQEEKIPEIITEEISIEEIPIEEISIEEMDVVLPEEEMHLIEEKSNEIIETENVEGFSDTQEENEKEERMDLVEQKETYAADFEFYVTEDIPSVKAGESVGYELYLENTGDVDLENLVLRSILDNGNMAGQWLEADGLTVDYESDTAKLSLLEAGASKTLVFMVDTEEDSKEEITAEFLVRAVNPLNEEEILSQSVSMTTKVTPLTIDFSVTKWADRKMVLLGETIMYQICIRNTGERTLHSVLTTEKFVNAGVQAVFQEKEGVILNGSKTQALISEIKPGEAIGLNALVTIPENMESGELLNEVIVLTAETGEQKFTAQAAVEILESAEEVLEETATPQAEKIEGIAQVPKTEDLSETEFWAGIFAISCLIVIGIYWRQKTKRKH